jgi:glycosyltransferase involved in cell wall biosynthesis
MISIIIAAYNCEPYLDQAIKSIQAQSCQDFEVIIVNDGSTDKTQQLAEQLAQEDPRIRVISQANSGGPAQPRNLGIAQSSGEYVCFLDPDDYWYPDKLEKQLTLMSLCPDVDMVFCDLNRVDRMGLDLGLTYLGRVNYMETAIEYLEQIGPEIYISKPGFLAYSSVNVVGPTTCSVMLRRRRLNELGDWFPLDLLVGEDIDLWFRILQKSKAVFINRPLYAYRQHPTSLMHNDNRVNEGLVVTHVRNYERVQQLLSFSQKIKYRRRVATHLFDFGYQLRLKGENAQARGAYLQSFVWYPQVGTVLAWFKSLLPISMIAVRRCGND